MDDTSQVPVAQKAQPEVKDVFQTSQQPTVVPQTPSGLNPPAKPKKDLIIKVLVILIILVGLGLGGFFVWKNFFATGTEVDKSISVVGEEGVGEEAYIYKGIWLPGIPQGWLASNIQEMKDLGMNTVSLAIIIIQEGDNPLVGLDTSYILDDIQTAHENGMKVMLTPIIYPKPRLEEKDLGRLDSLIIEAAKLAEEHDVELFAPLAEPPTIITGDLYRSWMQEIIPKVKNVYHGEIYWSSPGVGSPPDKATISQISKQPPGDFAGYDYIGLTTLFPLSERLEPEEQLRWADRLTLEGYAQYVEGAIDYRFAHAKRDNCKGIIIDEFGVMDRFFPSGSGVGDVLEEGWMSEEELSRAIEIVFEKGKDKASGFIVANFLRMEVPGMPGVYVKGVSKTEKEVIRKWFREIL